MLDVKTLTKAYGGRTVVDRLDLTVGRGEVLGFLGPNGAGKSTTMRMIAGMIEPDSGSIDLCGHSVLVERLKAQGLLGYLPEGAPLYLDMTPRGFLNFLSGVRRVPRAERPGRLAQVIADCRIAEVMDTMIGALSKGYRRRVALAGAILHDPPVLVLDEPTDGLDPNQKRAVHELIRRLAPEKAILISTHTLEEVETMCTRAVIVNRGRIVAQDTPQGFIAKAPGGRFADLFAAVTGAHEDMRA